MIDYIIRNCCTAYQVCDHDNYTVKSFRFFNVFNQKVNWIIDWFISVFVYFWIIEEMIITLKQRYNNSFITLKKTNSTKLSLMMFTDIDFDM